MLFPLYDLNPHRRWPVFTMLIIAANVAVTVWMFGLNPRQANETVFRYGFVPQRISKLDSGQPVNIVVPKIDRRGRQLQFAGHQVLQLSTDARDVYPTFITTMFLHGGLLHLALNMWWLWIFGNNIEDRLGHLMFVCFYFLGGTIASLCHWAIDPTSTIPVVGASGAVAAVLGAYAITFPSAKVKTLVFVLMIWIVDLPALAVLGIWFVLQLISGVNSLHPVAGAAHESVAFWAHVGGFVAGVVLMPFLSLGAAPPGTDWRKEADEMFRFEDPRTRME